jgi:hypothetical protein
MKSKEVAVNEQRNNYNSLPVKVYNKVTKNCNEVNVFRHNSTLEAMWSCEVED